METEIVDVYDENTGKTHTYEVGEYLTWEERLKQVKQGQNEKVYCLYENVRTYNHGKGMVTSWFSIGKDAWEKCRRVIRKIN